MIVVVVVVVEVERVRRNVHLLVELSKMKIGGFKTGHCYHKPSDAAIQQEPSGVSSGVWLPRLSQNDFDRVVQTIPSGLLAVSDAEGRPGTSKILRPQLDQCPDLTDIYLQADVQCNF